MRYREEKGETAAARLPDEVDLVEPHRLDELVGVLDLALDVVVFVVQRISGHSRSELIGRKDMKAPAEAGEVLRPDVGAGMTREAFAMHEDHRLAGTRLVIARAHAVDVDELGLEPGDRAIFRGGDGRRAGRQERRSHQRCEREPSERASATAAHVVTAVNDHWVLRPGLSRVTPMLTQPRTGRERAGKWHC